MHWVRPNPDPMQLPYISEAIAMADEDARECPDCGSDSRNIERQNGRVSPVTGDGFIFYSVSCPDCSTTRIMFEDDIIEHFGAGRLW